MKNQFFLQVFVKFFTKKKVIFFALRVKVKKFKKMKKMPLFAFPHKAWGGVYYAPPCNRLSGPSGRILDGWMPFSAINRILNFIVLQKFLSFCPFFTIFFLFGTKIKTRCHKILFDNSLGLKEHFSRILAVLMSFPATNLILNFGKFVFFLKNCK